jgi:acyl-CoA reductase-like NAD-dependent aldehyde dehydrogenase
MAVSLIKMPKPVRADPGSGAAAEAPDAGAFNPVAARAAWLDAIRALARAAAQADHDAATRTTGRTIPQKD